MNHKHYLLAVVLLTVVGCDRLEKDVLNAPADNELDRYGLESVKLGDQKRIASKPLNALLNQPMQCQSGVTGVGNTRKAFALETCHATLSEGSVGQLWNEKLTEFKAIFVENQLCSLELQLRTSGNYEALYTQHGQKILNLFGKPDDASSTSVRWQREGDETMLQDLGNGNIRLTITNKQVMQALHHTGE